MTALNRRYTAFISYSHADNVQLGRQWASWFHQSLETYGIPPELVATINQRSERIPDSLYPIFRDEKELPAGEDLSEGIRLALSNSDSLIVLCSPAAVASEFVNSEIRYFKELGKGQRIIAVLLYGEPNADRPAKVARGMSPADEAFPFPLRFGRRTVRGDIDWSVRADLLAADVRPGKGPCQGWTTAGAYRQQLAEEGCAGAELEQRTRVYEDRLAEVILKVVSGILAVPVGMLAQRDAEYRRREAERRADEERALREQAEQHRRRAEDLAAAQSVQLQRISRADCATALDYIRTGQRRKALAYYGRALDSWPENERAKLALWDAFVNGRDDIWPLPLLSVPHRSGVNSLAISLDGRRLITGSGKEGLDEFSAPREGTDECTAKLWDLETGKELFTLRGHDDVVSAVAISPDGQLLLTGSWDRTAKLWATDSSAESRTLSHSDQIWSVAFSPDGQRVVTGGGDSTARIWEVGSGKEILAFDGRCGTVFSVAFSPDGRRLLTGFGDGQVRLWDTMIGNELLALRAHSGEVHAVAFSPDGRRLVTGGEDHTAKLWDAETGKELLTFQGHTRAVYAVAFSPDGRRVLTGSHDFSAKFWDAERGQELQTLQGHAHVVGAVKFSHDGGCVLTGGWDETAKLWEADSGRNRLNFFEPQGPLLTVALSPNGRWLFVGSERRAPELWLVESREKARTLGAPLRSHTVAFSPDSKTVITVTETGDGTLWNVENGTEMLTLPAGFLRHITAATFSPDGQHVLTGGGDGAVRLWEAQTGKELQTFQKRNFPVKSVAFSPDGKRLLAAFDSSGQTRIWDAGSGKPLRTLEGKRGCTKSVAFSPDGQHVLIGGSGGADVWDVKSGKMLLSLAGNFEWIHTVAYSPDGQYLLTGDDKAKVQLWRAQDGSLLVELPRHRGIVIHVTFSTDGQKIVTAGTDQMICIGDFPTPLATPPDWLASALVSESGYEFSEDGMLTEVPLERRMEVRDRLPRFRGNRHGWDRLLQVLARVDRSTLAGAIFPSQPSGVAAASAEPPDSTKVELFTRNLLGHLQGEKHPSETDVSSTSPDSPASHSGPTLWDPNKLVRDLALLHPVFREKVEEVLDQLRQEGIPLRVFESFRSPQRQDFLYRQGRTLPGRRVTNARAWESYHHYGCAADFFFRENDRWRFESSPKRENWYKRLSVIGRGVGLEPLRWETSHLQLAGTSLEELRQGRYPDGGDCTWAENLSSWIRSWRGEPAAPPLPRSCPTSP